MGVSKITDGPLIKTEADVDRMEALAPALIRGYAVIAHIRRQNYLLHLEAGFTEAQALELVKHDGDLLFR